MPDCSRCGGEGEESYDEDGRTVTDVCYHCLGSGKVDEETDFRDKLHGVAACIAYGLESDRRKAIDSDPEGDGYNLSAYENQMTPSDYFRCRVWERTEEVAQKLELMSYEDQKFLLAWKEQWENMPIVYPAVKTPVIKDGQVYESEVVLSDDEIPF